MKDTSVKINLCLQRGGAVDAIGCGACSSQACLGSSEVLQMHKQRRLKQLNLKQRRLVIDSLQLTQQLADALLCTRVLSVCDQQRAQPLLDALTQELLIGLLAPCDVLITQRNLLLHFALVLACIVEQCANFASSDTRTVTRGAHETYGARVKTEQSEGWKSVTCDAAAELQTHDAL